MDNNTVRIKGRISGELTDTGTSNELLADFTLVSGNYSFQVVIKRYNAVGLSSGLAVIVAGELRESAGDVYIYARSVKISV